MAETTNTTCDCTGSAVGSLPSVQKNFVLLLSTGQNLVISAFINICHFETSFVFAFELPSCSASV